MQGRALSKRASPLLAAAVAPPHSRCLLGRAALEEIEAEAIRFAITHYGGRMSKVARRLRIGRPTLYRKLDSLGRDVSDPKKAAW
jgi:DNA-binding NtrC family response regulator